jgi:molybdate transport system substrate-binding protein
MARLARIAASALVALGLVAACAGGHGAGPTPPTPGSAVGSSSPPPTALTVFAAASLKKPFGAVEAGYRTAHPEVTLTFSFDASSALEAQIEQGAPADVFASADTKNPQKLVDGGFATGPVTSFAGNHLAIIVPTANPAGISSPLDLAMPGLKLIAAGDDVPIRKYADQLVDNLAREAGYPADFSVKVRANVVSREDNVAAVVSKIELGEGDAAIVYVTDAKGSTKVTPIAVPDRANVPATYGAVSVKVSKRPDAAAAFIAWLAGPGGQSILAEYGFLPPS